MKPAVSAYDGVMPPLTLDDLISLDEYVARRREHLTAQARYLDRYRRVRVGPSLTLIFENRQTLWFRIQELLRVARLADPLRVQQELDWYNRLLPGRDRLQAALLIDDTQNRDAWCDMPDSALAIECGDHTCPARIVTSRPEDRCFGAAHWVEFTVGHEARASLGNRRQPAVVAAHHGDYHHPSVPLSDVVRQSLLDDLTLSDRDRAA